LFSNFILNGKKLKNFTYIPIGNVEYSESVARFLATNQEEERMRPFCTLQFLAVSALIATLPALAQEGGGDTGGGNLTCDGHPVVTKAVPIESLKGFPELRARLEKIRDAAPYLVKEIEERIPELTFYSVPCALDEISREQSGLHFRNVQACRQNGATDEVFCESKWIERLSNDEMSMQLMQELLEALRQNKASGFVRPVLEKIFADPVDPIALQGALAREGFGAYFGKTASDAYRSYLRGAYYGFLADVLAAGQAACESGKTQDQIKNVLFNKFGVPEYSKVPQSLSLRWSDNAGRTNKPDPTIPGNRFLSPFSSNGWGLSVPEYAYYWEHSLERTFLEGGCIAPRPELASREACAELRAFDPEAKAFTTIQFKTKPEVALRTEAALHADFGIDGRDVVSREIKSLAREKSFLDIMALIKRPGATALKPPLDPAFDAVYMLIAGHHVEANSPTEARNLLCGSISSLRKEVVRRRDGSGQPAEPAQGNEPAKVVPAS
jgi:hypothetical protein